MRNLLLKGVIHPLYRPPNGLKGGKAHLKPPNLTKAQQDKKRGGGVGTHESRILLGLGGGPINPKKGEIKEKEKRGE